MSDGAYANSANGLTVGKARRQLTSLAIGRTLCAKRRGAMLRILLVTAVLTLAGCAAAADCPKDKPECKPSTAESVAGVVLTEVLNPWNWLRW